MFLDTPRLAADSSFSSADYCERGRCVPAMFGAVMRQIDISSAERGAPALAADVVAILLDNAEDHASSLRQLGLLRRNESIEKLSFAYLRERVRRACDEKVTVNAGLRRWQGGLSETVLYEMSLKSGQAAAI